MNKIKTNFDWWNFWESMFWSNKTDRYEHIYVNETVYKGLPLDKLLSIGIIFNPEELIDFRLFLFRIQEAWKMEQRKLIRICDDAGLKTGDKVYMFVAQEPILEWHKKGIIFKAFAYIGTKKNGDL